VLTNDVLRSLRFMLKVDEASVARLIEEGGAAASVTDVRGWLKREDEPGFVQCPAAALGAYLDALVVHRRGFEPVVAPRVALTNNLVLKKLRVAFELRDDDLMALMARAGFALSKHELSALFRAPGHKNFRPCGDQFLRNFLKGLTAAVRGGE
jgi:uncharacterized protein YehS (DUF1456 family)